MSTIQYVCCFIRIANYAFATTCRLFSTVFILFMNTDLKKQSTTVL
jgi:hypothetical protein